MTNELFLLRVAVGVIFIYHSLPKLQNPKGMAAGMGWTTGQVLGLGIVEFISAIGLIGGLAVNISSLLLIVVMLGAIFHKIKIWKVPFMAHDKTGWEFDFLLLLANLTIYLN
jgi:putative oxidoreductase